MGAYLSEPVVEKQTESAGDNGIHYGATSMQGWRINQEDAHNCILNFDENCAFFAVYDGHGGPDVSQYAAKKFPQFLKSVAAWNEGRVGQALEDAFLKFDELLTSEDVLEELKEIAGTKKKENEGDEADEDKALLYEEAGLPLESVLQRYGLNINRSLFVAGTEGLIVSKKIKIKRESRVPASATIVEDQEGPPTPPSSPDARSAMGSAIRSATANKSRKNAEQACPENVEPQPMSPPNVDSSLQQSGKHGLKRKSQPQPVGSNEDIKHHSGVSTNADCNSVAKDECDSTQTNGIEIPGDRMAGDGTDSPVDELPHLKRFKGANLDSNSPGKILTDNVVVLDESNEPTSTVTEKAQEINGRNDGASNVHSVTSGDYKAHVNNGNEITSTLGNSAGSPMLVEDQVNRTNDEQNLAQSHAENKSCAMDESSGASEDDEDEDYNMEVEDDESSEEGSSESDAGEDTEATDEQEGMGVDEEEEDEDEEEAEDDDMFAMPSGDTPGVDSGTTACVAVIKGSTMYVANAGDSRCVLCRGNVAVDLSVDHKPEDDTESRRIRLAGGRISMDGRVNGGLNLSRAIGDHFYKRNSELPLRDQMITALPDIRVESLKPEDQFVVLACDGIWNSMSSQAVVDFVRTRLDKGLTPGSICEQLCDVCLAPDTIGDGTGCDNMTAIIVLLNQNTADSNVADPSITSTGNSTEASENGASCT